jgi:hypothetical protein
VGHRISIGRRGIRVELFLEECEKVVVRQLSESGGGAGEVPEGGCAVIHGLVRAVEAGGGGRMERPESYKAGRDGENGGCLGRTIKGDGLHDCLSLRPDPIRLHTPMANSVSSNRRHSPSLVGHQIAHPLKWTATCLLPCIVSVFSLVLYVLQTKQLYARSQCRQETRRVAPHSTDLPLRSITSILSDLPPFGPRYPKSTGPPRHQ